MGSSKGEGSANPVPQLDGDEFVGDGDVVPRQPDDVFDVLSEHDDQDGGGAIAHGELSGVYHPLNNCVLLGRG